jgi:hypothetical protein
MACIRALARTGRLPRVAMVGLASLGLLGPMTGCLQVPKASVELSTTVGRDIEAARDAHRSLAKMLFARMKRDVDRFVDGVYAPHQIQVALAGQRARQAKGDGTNLFSVLASAQAKPGDAQAQTDALDLMQITVEMIHDDVEAFRAERMKGLLQQEADVMTAIEATYDQILKGNAVVTAHLASIVKVNDVQDDLLKRAGEKDLRERVGVKLSETSARLGAFVDTAKRLEGPPDASSPKLVVLAKELDALLKGKP